MSDPPVHAEPEALGTPYRNLWVPLIVVPFLVVGVIVLVYAFFGAIAGREASLSENLERILRGGTNERQQAAASLAQQIVANEAARAEGREPPYPSPADFADELERAWEELGERGNANLKLLIARALALYEPAEEPREGGAREKLESFLALSDEEDPESAVRFNALEALGALGDPASAAVVIPYLDHSDPLLRQGAAIALQAMPGPESVAALESLLDEDSLALRGTAAVSLSHLGRASGANVLRDLTEPATYAAVRKEEPRKFPPAAEQRSRITAILALARLGLEEDRALLERLAAGDADPLVREAAMRGLAQFAGSGPEK